jgi:hypothetical protein
MFQAGVILSGEADVDAVGDDLARGGVAIPAVADHRAGHVLDGQVLLVEAVKGEAGVEAAAEEAALHPDLVVVALGRGQDAEARVHRGVRVEDRRVGGVDRAPA